MKVEDISSLLPKQCLSYESGRDMVENVQRFINKTSGLNRAYVYLLESSMKNCFSLLPLHNFIQVPYFCRKETMLHLQLQQILAGRKKVRSDLHKSAFFQDYAKILTVSPPSTHLPSLFS